MSQQRDSDSKHRAENDLLNPSLLGVPLVRLQACSPPTIGVSRSASVDATPAASEGASGKEETNPGDEDYPDRVAHRGRTATVVDAGPGEVEEDDVEDECNECYGKGGAAVSQGVRRDGADRGGDV